MDLSQPKSAPPGDTEKTSADPFASDIFADSKTKSEIQSEIAPIRAGKEKPDWVWRLPKAARPAADWDALWRNLPDDFSDDLPGLLAGALAGYLNAADENPVEFLFFIKRELSETPESRDDSWWGTVAVENSKAEFAVEIDDGFAAWLVDAMLGEKVSERIEARDLTTSEIAVLEFLAVNLTHEANRIVNAPLFKFRTLSRKSPAWMTGKNRDTSTKIKNANPLLESNWQTVHGIQQSITKLYFTPETLNALQADENKLLTAAPRRRAIWKSLENRVKDVRARIFLGDVRLTLADVGGLETGDVVLPENYGFSVSGGSFYGNAEIFLGDGEHVKITGASESFADERADEADEQADKFEETAAAVDNESIVRRIKSNHALRFSIEYFEELENAQSLEKFMPEESLNLTDEENENFFEDEAGGGVPLENLAVTLRVELEARRLTLAEVGNLREGQIIELGVRAADPVNLMIDNKTIARGELVEIDEQLGVRIIQILR